MVSKRILVIDDEPDVIKYMSLFLFDEGYEVISAADGFQGLEKASEESPDLITLDITMPGMSGIEVLTALRSDEKLRDIPVIVITGVAGIKKLMDYREVRPPEKFMQKPIDRMRLAEMIQELIGS
jgi:CheY-like chemotaxis protein